mmetsp:Transcript_40552/g.100152  ORF Transcript_40552/g.100152 Transcript_40552/m.100152 type:complete len:707 (-) Transcript_40552:364-2484(-)
MERMTKPVVYHLKSKTGTCNPLHLVRAAMRMQQFVASMLNRSLCVLPEPNCNTPSYVKVDTKMAALHILTDEDVSALGVSRSVLSKQISTHKKAIWARILEVDQRRFTPNAQRGLEFSGSISTDASGVSIQLCTKGYTRGDELDSEGGNGGNEEYVDQVDRAIYEGKRIVSIDPNMRDLMYAAAPKDHAASHDEPIRDRDDLITWRFTLMQRRFETGEKKFRKVREHLRKQRLSEQDARSAEAIEKHLPARYAPSLLALGDRIVQRTRATLATLELYRRKKWRAMRIRGKLLKQRCDARMVSSFGETFGRPGEVVIAFGDASNAHNPRHHRPAKRKGYRQVFRKAGYTVLLVNEYRTSKSCARCTEGECCTFKKRETSRPYRTGNVEVHGLLTCQGCGCQWNRDVLASANMLEITRCAARGLDRPGRFAPVVNRPAAAGGVARLTLLTPSKEKSGKRATTPGTGGSGRTADSGGSAKGKRARKQLPSPIDSPEHSDAESGLDSAPDPNDGSESEPELATKPSPAAKKKLVKSAAASKAPKSPASGGRAAPRRAAAANGIVKRGEADAVQPGSEEESDSDADDVLARRRKTITPKQPRAAGGLHAPDDDSTAFAAVRAAAGMDRISLAAAVAPDEENEPPRGAANKPAANKAAAKPVAKPATKAAAKPTSKAAAKPTRKADAAPGKRERVVAVEPARTVRTRAAGGR